MIKRVWYEEFERAWVFTVGHFGPKTWRDESQFPLIRYRWLMVHHWDGVSAWESYLESLTHIPPRGIIDETER